MYIYEKYDYSLFAGRFRHFNRYNDLGGYDGLNTLYKYLEDVASDTGEPIEFDCIALCCDWAYCDEDTLIDDYGYLFDADMVDIDDLVEELEQRTTVLITPDGNYLVQAF